MDINHWMSLSHSCLPIRFGRTRLSKRENWIIDRDRLHGNIRDFFDEQRIGGNAQRDESDCRSHFYHWIIKHLNTTRYGTKRKFPTYRDSDVTAVSAEDYEGAF